MARDESDHSIREEDFRPSVSTDRVRHEPALGNHFSEDTEEDRVRSSIWDEPSLRAAGGATPEGVQTYAAWFARRRRETPAGDAIAATLLLALSGGPFAVLGAFVTGGGAGVGAGILMVVLVAPVVEELLKAGATLIALERKPYLFKTSAQIYFAVVVSALCFATIENLLYIHVYIEEPSAEIVRWRWTVCTFLHVGCSSIAALGLARMYRAALRRHAPPDVKRAYPMLVAAIAIHGVYNAAATAIEFLITPM